MNPCYPCGCMLEDNLGCPEMSHCYKYHVYKDPNFERSLYTLDPLVRDMLIMRIEDYEERITRLFLKNDDISISEIIRLLDVIIHDKKTLCKDNYTYIRRSMFDV